METRPEVVSELRTLFREGATPSRLILHIVERHEGEQRFHLLIQRYFREAFGVPIVRGLNPIDDYQHADLRFDYLNQQLLHEMVEKRSEWDSDESECWLDAITANSDEERNRQVRDLIPTELKRVWADLTSQEQRRIHVVFSSANGLYETVRIMSRLLEALQQQVNELQAPVGVAGE